MSNMITFFNEVRAELAKVTWPKREDLIGAVIIVCFLSLVFAILIGFMDALVAYAIQWLIR